MATPTNFQLLSTSFQRDGDIPKKFTRQGSDISPALAWTQAPPNTQSFALIMEDPDAPRGSFVHWVVYDLPAGSAGIPEGLPKESKLQDGTLQGKNGFGKIGYSGPCPPAGAPHRYVFKLYALNIKLKIKPEATRTDLWNAIKDHIRATAVLVGRYQTSQEAEKQVESPDPGVRGRKSRQEALENNPDYLMKTDKLQMELKKAHSLSPTTVKKFFRSVAFFRRPAEVQRFLKDRQLRRPPYARRFR